jgi:hypothetical protein
VTVLTVCQDVCRKVGIATPAAIFGSTEREHEELASLANEVADRLITDYDWNRLKRLNTYTGDGATTSFLLPTDYSRMASDVYSTQWACGPLRRIADTNQWLRETVQGFTSAPATWTLLEGRMQFLQAPASGEGIRWYYMSTLFARSSGSTVSDFFPLDLPFEFPDSDTYGQKKARFDDDADFFQLDERLLRLGMLWQWKADKGLPYAEDLETFSRFLEQRVVKDAGPRLVTVGGRAWEDDGLTYPRTLSAG